MPLIKIGPDPEEIRVDLLNRSADLLLRSHHNGTADVGPAAQAMGGVPVEPAVKQIWQDFAQRLLATNNPRAMRKLYKEFLIQENLTDG